MATVHDVAAALIRGQHEGDRTIDKLQLQKLLYLVQGAALAHTGQPAFTAAIRAYKHGPVVAEVEETYRPAATGRGPISVSLGGDASRLGPELQRVVDDVLRIFGGWTGPHLEKFTKKSQSPWHQARPGLADHEPSRNVIDIDAIADWFAVNPLDPNESRVYEPVRDIDLDEVAGEPVGFDDEVARWNEEDVGRRYILDRSKVTVLS